MYYYIIMRKNLKEFKVTERITQRSEVLDKYLTEVSKVPLLTREEEHELSLKMIEGDVEAKNKMINANLRFVVSVAKSFGTSNKVALEDLISQGNVGLIESAETFDPTTGFKFISYAVWHIRKHIYQFLNEHSRTVRVPSNVGVELNRARKIESRLMQQNDRDITIDEILEVFEQIGKPSTVERLSRAIVSYDHSIPLEKPASDTSDIDSSPISFLDSGENPERSTDASDAQIIFKEVFKVLTKMEKNIVVRRLGLENGEPASYAEIAESYDISHERIRQIFHKSLKKLKKMAVKIKWVPDDYKEEKLTDYWWMK